MCSLEVRRNLRFLIRETKKTWIQVPDSRPMRTITKLKKTFSLTTYHFKLKAHFHHTYTTFITLKLRDCHIGVNNYDRSHNCEFIKKSFRSKLMSNFNFYRSFFQMTLLTHTESLHIFPSSNFYVITSKLPLCRKHLQCILFVVKL